MNRYQFIQTIQENENTCVAKVQDQITGKVCIQKSISLQAGYLVLHQFHIEIDVLSSLHHPHIPEILDVFQEKDQMFLIESYIPGKTFESYLSSSSYHFRIFRFRYVLELMDLLEQIHKIGYLYVDLKGSNVILDHNHVYLIDFNACLPLHSTQAVFASKENASSELFTNEIKDEKVDIYSLGKFVQKLYPLSMYFFVSKCTKKDAKKRFSNWKKMKHRFIISIIIRFIIYLIIILVSVFLLINQYWKGDVSAMDLYVQNPNCTTFFNAYHETLSNLTGQSSDKNALNLYQWIEKGWIDDALWQEESISRFLLYQAIQSHNPNLCEAVLENIQPSKNRTKYITLAEYIISPNLYIEKSTVDSFLLNLEEGDISLLIPILIDGQYEIDESQQDILNQMIHKEEKNYTSQEAIPLLEYNLFLKSIQSKQSLDLSYLEKTMKEDEEWNSLYDIYRRTK